MNVRFACTMLSVVLLASTSAAERYHVADIAKLVSLSDPQISPDGKSIALVVSRNNLDTDEHDAEILLIDIASHATRVLTRKPHAGFPRWSPDGKSLAFLAADDKKHLQIFTLDLANGGDSQQLTHSPTSIEQLAWRPDGKAFAFVAEDDEPKREGRAKFDDAFEIGNNDFLAHSAQMPAHLWLVDLPTDSDALKMPEPKRLTHGSWSLPISLPPGPPASPIQWSPDGKQIVFVKVPTPLSGDAPQSTIQVLDVASSQFKPLTGAPTLESIPVLHPTAPKSPTSKITTATAGKKTRSSSPPQPAAPARTSPALSTATSFAKSGCPPATPSCSPATTLPPPAFGDPTHRWHTRPTRLPRRCHTQLGLLAERLRRPSRRAGLHRISFQQSRRTLLHGVRERQTRAAH